MFRKDLLPIVRPDPGDSECQGLEYLEGTEENGRITSGRVLDPKTGEDDPV